MTPVTQIRGFMPFAAIVLLQAGPFDGYLHGYFPGL